MSNFHATAGWAHPAVAVRGRRAGERREAQALERTLPYTQPLPGDAAGALAVIQRLCRAGHRALLNGGCVRDLLRGAAPYDYDVATSATPDQVCSLFRVARTVGVSFGVVLVRSAGRQIEVATFRSDGEYRDGRRPESVRFCDEREDAQRRDFTVNGMFLDPLAGVVIDYVGGIDDLKGRRIRAIGDAPSRFAEDYLRLLRAIRFAARLEFSIEPATAASIRASAARLARIAPERVREELEKMLSHRGRARATQLLHTHGLLPFLWNGAEWTEDRAQGAIRVVAALDEPVPFFLGLEALLSDRPPAEVDRIARELTCSNRDREAAGWLCRSAPALFGIERLPLAALKRLMARPEFPQLRNFVTAQLRVEGEAQLRRALDERLGAIDPHTVAPPPFLTGDDLAARGVPAGPIYRTVLDSAYDLQLEGSVASREEALARLPELIRSEEAR